MAPPADFSGTQPCQPQRRLLKITPSPRIQVAVSRANGMVSSIMLNVGCTAVSSSAAKSAGVWTVDVGTQRITIKPDEITVGTVP